jgi:cysteine desulfurase
MRKVYLDHTATTPLDPQVLEAMQPYFAPTFGNASSIHAWGREARVALDESRDVLAKLVGMAPGEFVFTGSGTEADNHAIKGVAARQRSVAGKAHIVTSVAEHHAVLETCRFLETQGYSVTYLPVDGTGMVDPETVRRALTSATALVSIMAANNEVGTLNPVSEIGAIVRERGIPFHTDAVQVFAKLPLPADATDLVSVSAHKIYGPKGIGGLALRKGTPIERLLHGGAQERGRRAGTENVAFAVGFATAAQRSFADQEGERRRLLGLKGELRDLLEDAFPEILFNGHPSLSLPHIVNVSFDSRRIALDGEALLFNLDLAGIAVTSGSACTSGSMEPSHVLLALGRDAPTARASLRFSMGRSTTSEDLVYVVGALREIIQRIGRPAA